MRALGKSSEARRGLLHIAGRSAGVRTAAEEILATHATRIGFNRQIPAAREDTSALLAASQADWGDSSCSHGRGSTGDLS